MTAALNSPAAIDHFHAETRALGWALLQPFRFAETDEAHIDFLLRAADFPANARVLDIGCGIGECARLMKLARPDLDFVLLNFSSAQLDDCPDGFEKHHADAHALPFEDGTFDAVMFNAALGNMDCMVALAEASRVMKPGGVLFLNELARVNGNNTELERLLNFRAYLDESLCDFAEAMGFVLSHSGAPAIVHEHLFDKMDAADYCLAFGGVVPMLWRFVKGAKTPIAAKHGAIFHRHARIALQISGGKDSLAVLQAMTPWHERLCVYWCNPGDAFPETIRLMANIRANVPYFVEIAGRQADIVAQDGWPSDVVPQAHTSDGNFVFGPTPFKVQSRLSCCFRSLMLPMHERMVADGVTCIIRGKRSAEKDKTVTRTGSVLMGIETIYPIWDFSEKDVTDFLVSEGIAIPASYDYATHSLDCMSCTAWNEEGLHHWLKEKYPEHFKEHKRRIVLIRNAVVDSMVSTGWVDVD